MPSLLSSCSTVSPFYKLRKFGWHALRRSEGRGTFHAPHPCPSRWSGRATHFENRRDCGECAVKCPGHWFFLALLIAVHPSTAHAQKADAPPRSLDPRIKIELFADAPQIVTPTGIDVDHRGRVWAIESNTHFRPAEYKGHPSDRVLVMSDTDHDGKADRITTFADGLTFTMSVAVVKPWQDVGAGVRGQDSGVGEKKSAILADPKSQPPNPKSRTAAYIATRREIFLMHDDDGDDVADRKQSIVHLETQGNYPHNGLAGFAFDALGWMFFGFGENLGAGYKIIGSDGTTLSGGGEGGNLYRCRLDGSKLERWATGFWNPHASCFDAFGRLFTVDNDPDSRPPCRLLHIIPGGDYGYRFRNGRKGLHPFTSWNGEIPGTLPMVAGTGEAPSGIVAYESDGLPEEYLGNLLVTSWGDHRIDRFRLKPKGASFTSFAEPIITGGENFRPVGLALAPDGSLYCTDWVLKDYKLHGKGRVWRISSQEPNKKPPSAIFAETAIPELVTALRNPLLDHRRLAASHLTKTDEGTTELFRFTLERKYTEPLRPRMESYWALQRAAFDLEWARRVRMAPPRQIVRVNDGPVDELYRQMFWWAYSLDSLTEDPARLSIAYAVAGADYEKEDGDDAILAARMSEKHIIIRSQLFNGPVWNEPRMDQYARDPFVFSLKVQMNSRVDNAKIYQTWWRFKPTALGRVAFTLAQRLHNSRDTSLLDQQLKDEDDRVRRIAIQWVAEERLKEFRPQVEAILRDQNVSADLFLATLAALEMLDGVPPAEFDKTPPGKYVLPLLKNEQNVPAVRARALALVDPNDPALTDELMIQLLKSEDAGLKLEAIHTMQGVAKRGVSDTLRDIAKDTTADVSLRAEAIVALAATVHGRVPDDISLTQLRQGGESLDPDPILWTERLRALRGHTDNRLVERSLRAKGGVLKMQVGNGEPTAIQRELADQIAFALAGAKIDLPISSAPFQSKRPTNRAEWNDVLKAPGDAAAGRRTFFHVNSAGCYKCHTVNGRGGRIGPDLSTVGRALSRERLIDSILEPSKEIAPQFVSWSVETTAGKVHTGMIVHENEGKTILGNAQGQLIELKTLDIAERVPQTTSVMPDKLAERLTPQEFRDLLAFLESLK